ncbi:unnamed protein product, partial [Tetraodon nigroviridis]
AMEVAPAVALLLCVSLRLSLAAQLEFVDTNFTLVDEAIDYKDPCKAGRICSLLCARIDDEGLRLLLI